jgi:hypothetical protein
VVGICFAAQKKRSRSRMNLFYAMYGQRRPRSKKVVVKKVRKGGSGLGMTGFMFLIWSWNDHYYEDIAINKRNYDYLKQRFPLWPSSLRSAFRTKETMTLKRIMSARCDRIISGTWDLNLWHMGLEFVAHGTRICGTWDGICGTRDWLCGRWFSYTTILWYMALVACYQSWSLTTNLFNKGS